VRVGGRAVSAGIVPKWLTLGNGLTVAVIAPALVWSFLNLLLTLGLGHPTESTIEVPYLELVIQLVLAGIVFLLLSRVDKTQWLVILIPIIIWSLVRGWFSGISPLWSLALAFLLLSPLISLLLAGHPALTNMRVLRSTFVIIMVGQLITFPFNLSYSLMDDDASFYDRFSGTLLGKGGYFSSYVLLAGVFFLLLSRAQSKVKLAVLITVMAYAWFAEVKLIWFVAGALASGVLIMNATRKSFVWKIPVAFLLLISGALLSLLVPSSLALAVDWAPKGISIAGTTQQAMNLTQLAGDTPESVSGSKILVIVDTLNPWSDLWATSDENVVTGVGPGGGLSNLSRTADAQTLFVDQQRPDSEFRENARALAGSQQQDQSLATQPETTILGIVSELGYLGLILFLAALALVFRFLLKKFDRSTVGIILGFVIAFVPLFSLWEVSGFWMVLALGLAAFGRRRNSTLS